MQSKTKNMLRVATLCVHFASLGCLLFLGAFGFVSELFGPPTYLKLLAYLNSLWIEDIYWIMLIVCLAVFFATHWLQRKLNG